MIDLKHIDKLFQRQPGSSLLGLALDGSRLEGALVRRTNGSVEVKKAFATSLSLDPLTAETELAGREIRKQLDAEQIRERWCAVCLPLNWALTLTVKLPDMPEEDVADFLQIEAERGFPYGPDELAVAQSRFRAADGSQYATLVAISREQVARLIAVLEAAQLRPAAFSLGLTALPATGLGAEDGTLALLPGENTLGMQITCGGGVATLRTIDGAYEQAGAGRELQVEQIIRELRITLGQLPHEIRDAVQRVRVLGRNETAQELTEALGRSARDWGLRIESVREHGAEEFGLKIPSGTAISPALSLAVRSLAGQDGMEFLPPRVSPWQRFAERYSSGKLAYAGMAVGAVALFVLIAFLAQQFVLWRWQSRWAGMELQVRELTQMREDIRRYRPWFDKSVRTLSILKRLTEVFPQDGAVSAKMLELREPARVTCSGTARNRDALIKTLDQLRAVKEVSDVHIEMTRGNTPLEFTFNFQWKGPGGS